MEEHAVLIRHKQGTLEETTELTQPEGVHRL